MPVRKKKPEAVVPGQGTKGASKTQQQLRDEERRQKVMDAFHPDVVAFFKDNLGVDFSKLSTGTLYDIQSGKLTEPLEIVVTPLAYDRKEKKNVEMPRIKVFASLKAGLPFEGGKPVGLDKDHRVFIATVPCRPTVDRNYVPAIGDNDAEGVSTKDNPSFTDDQLLALEGIGIERSRLYGGFNHVSKDVKCSILDGEPFYVDGAVKTSFGIVNVIGEARLGEKDGKAVAAFEPYYPMEKTEERVVDLLEARINGTLELDFFRRRPDGRPVTDVNGVPMSNDAYRNLQAYGNAMEPVLGKVHRRRWDEKANKFVEEVAVGYYQVSVAPPYRVYDKLSKEWRSFEQGNVVITPMKAVEYKVGNDVKVRHEVPNVRMVDGKVFVDGQGSVPLEFVNEKEMENFLSGRGGLVKGATYHDYRTNSDLKYDGIVVADGAHGGYAHLFSPATTKKILESRSRKAGVMHARKSGFGLV